MNLLNDLFISPVTQLKTSNPFVFKIWVVLVILVMFYSLLSIVKNKKGGDMAKVTFTARYDLEDFFLNVQPTKQQLEKIEELCEMPDFNFATYYAHDNSFYFRGAKDYEAIMSFFKKLINIISGIDSYATITDKDEDVYWLLNITNDEIEECFGTIWWNTSEEKQKIIEVLKARLKTDNKEIIEDIADQICNAIVGDYDDVDGTEDSEDDEE